MGDQDWIRAAEIAGYSQIEKAKQDKERTEEERRAYLRRIYRTCNAVTLSIVLFLIYASTRNY